MNNRETLSDEFDVLGQLGPEDELGRELDLSLLKRGLIKESELKRSPFPWSRARDINVSLDTTPPEGELED